MCLIGTRDEGSNDVTAEVSDGREVRMPNQAIPDSILDHQLLHSM
jgi:hypothetical protein